MQTNLPDWNDYPFYVWTIYQNIGHFQTLTVHGFFDTNIFYPYKDSLLFSDILLPQSLLALPLTYFISNHILVFNLLFFFMLFLDVVAVYFFWQNVTSDKKELFFLVFATCISGFLFQNSVHFQFLSFWPFFFGLGYLVRRQKTWKDSLLLGLWTGIQFTAGVYLSIFLLTATAFWYGIELIRYRSVKTKVVALIQEGVITGSIFVVTAGVFLYKYLVIKKAYDITRLYWEYIYYSAHLSDYLFTTNYASVISSLWPISRWNALNHAGSLFPGLVIVVASVLGLFIYRKAKDSYELSVHIEAKDLFYFVLLLWGFFASLGPRLSVNGSYVGLPLPYIFPLKLIPLFDPIRVNGRWYLFVFIALLYFAIKGIRKWRIFARPIILVIVCLFIALEVMPISRKTEAKAYYHDIYEAIAPVCREKPQVLLEYPMTQDTRDVNIVTNLTYRTQAMLASLKHQCLLVNGYMGYAPKDYERYEQVLTDSVNRNVPEVFWRLIAEKNVRFIKLSKIDLFPEKVATVSAILQANKHVVILRDTDEYTLAEVRP